MLWQDPEFQQKYEQELLALHLRSAEQSDCRLLVDRSNGTDSDLAPPRGPASCKSEGA